jgi:hypothetical protein
MVKDWMVDRLIVGDGARCCDALTTSKLGHFRTWLRAIATSAFVRITDSSRTSRHVRFVPITEVVVSKEMKAKPGTPCATLAYVT